MLKELKNRKVFRSVAIYAGFAFVLLQVCSIIIPGLFLPEWTMTFIIVLTIIGFPIIAVLSWIYDITPTDDGEAPSKEAKQPLGVYALTGLVLTVIGIGFWVSISVFGLSFGGDDEVPSIAIIPFDNKGAEEDEFYAYGISSELISDVTSAGLIRVAGLKDIESLEYQTMKYDELSEKLLVRYIAHGSIWKIDSVFQLSMELYDTKTSKVLWSENWQKAWNELASIKGNLAENILKTLKVSTKQAIAKAPAPDVNAYEYYLKGKHKFKKRETLADVEIARELLQKAIEIDDELISAKIQLGETYEKYDDFDKAMEIYKKTLNQSEKLDEKRNIAIVIRKMGVIYFRRNHDYKKALDYFLRSLELSELIDDKSLISLALNNIGVIYDNQNKKDKSLVYHTRAMKIAEEIDDKYNIGLSSRNIGNLYYKKGDIDKAKDYYTRARKITEELRDKSPN